MGTLAAYIHALPVYCIYVHMPNYYKTIGRKKAGKIDLKA